MRIEKINENQIRCVLTGEDLASRQLQLSELAYGTDKAKALFRDMIQQAAYKFGFDAENIPLMIEAIPLSEGSIVLIVTKVENPEELDTRFSSFAPSVQEAPRSESDPGQNAFEQARQFTKATDVTAMAITKLDGTAKGGVVIGISNEFKIPVKYIGLGEGMEDLQPFNRRAFVDSLFGA